MGIKSPNILVSIENKVSISNKEAVELINKASKCISDYYLIFSSIPLIGTELFVDKEDSVEIVGIIFSNVENYIKFKINI